MLIAYSTQLIMYMVTLWGIGQFEPNPSSVETWKENSMYSERIARCKLEGKTTKAVSSRYQESEKHLVNSLHP